MKLKLKKLEVKSFVTLLDEEGQDTVKGGSGIQELPTIPINVCHTVANIHCNLSIERCTAGLTRCCV